MSAYKFYYSIRFNYTATHYQWGLIFTKYINGNFSEFASAKLVENHHIAFTASASRHNFTIRICKRESFVICIICEACSCIKLENSIYEYNNKIGPRLELNLVYVLTGGFPWAVHVTYPDTMLTIWEVWLNNLDWLILNTKIHSRNTNFVIFLKIFLSIFNEGELKTDR